MQLSFLTGIALAQIPSIAGINPDRSPVFSGETVIIRADLLNLGSGVIQSETPAIWTVQLPAGLPVLTVNFDDPSAEGFLTVNIGPYDPVTGTTVIISNESGEFPATGPSEGAYTALIQVKALMVSVSEQRVPIIISAALSGQRETSKAGTSIRIQDNASLRKSMSIQGGASLTDKPYSEDNSDSDSVESSFVFYPNPVKDFLYINGSVKAVKFYDVSGKLVYERSVPFSHIDLRATTPGIYIVKITDHKGLIHTGKVLKE
ncbi:hypothetical protein Dfri01_06610 [Dyadobacter frigoris]|nr:hypothetical protein Dfri01_06610 [Dyadobacter frigoris]